MAHIVTITNPVTGQPAQVDQLDHTAQQIDDAVEAARWSHRNLLDNAYWANADAIIDQRGGCVVPPDTPYYSDTGLTTQAGTVSAYTTASPGNGTYGTITISGTTYYVAWSAAVRGYTGAGYGINRWKMIGDSAAVVLDREFVTLHGNSSGAYWLQYIENKELYEGKMCTFSALYSDNVFHTVSGVITEGSDLTLTGAPGGWDIVKLDGNNLYVQYSANAGRTKSIIAAKLELGTHQTLAHQDENGNLVLNDPPPDPALELLKCMRYQQKIENISSGASIVGFGTVSTTTAIIFSIPLSAPLRNSTPAVTFKQAEYSYGATYVLIPSDATISGIRNNGNSVQVVVTFPAAHGLEIGTMVCLRLTKAYGAYVLIDNNL